MKWMLLITTSLLISSCCCNRVIEYRRVTVAPVVEPVVVYPRQGPIDVTTTTIDYY